MGVQHGSEAIKELEEIFRTTITHPGLFVSKERRYIAASPDSLINNRVQEIKCPSVLLDSLPNDLDRLSPSQRSAHFNKLNQDGGLTLKQSRELKICNHWSAIMIYITFFMIVNWSWSVQKMIVIFSIFSSLDHDHLYINCYIYPILHVGDGKVFSKSSLFEHECQAALSWVITWTGNRLGKMTCRRFLLHSIFLFLIKCIKCYWRSWLNG